MYVVYLICVIIWLSLLRPGRERSIVISLSVCLSVYVCLFVREHISGTTGPIFTNFLWPRLGSPLAALRYIMYLRFFYTFGCNGPYGD